MGVARGNGGEVREGLGPIFAGEAIEQHAVKSILLAAADKFGGDLQGARDVPATQGIERGEDGLVKFAAARELPEQSESGFEIASEESLERRVELLEAPLRIREGEGGGDLWVWVGG